jgi:hypothetical protein
MNAKKKTIGDDGAMIAAFFEMPQWRARYLIEAAESMAIEGRTNPSPRTDDLTKATRAGAWTAAYPFLYDEAVAPLIKEALETGNATEVWAALSKGSARVDSPPPATQVFRHVITSMKEAAHIMSKEDRMPTKAEVRAAVEIVFYDKGWGEAETEKTRWTEIFKAAGLSDLRRK